MIDLRGPTLASFMERTFPACGVGKQVQYEQIDHEDDQRWMLVSSLMVVSCCLPFFFSPGVLLVTLSFFASPVTIGLDVQKGDGGIVS